MAELVIEHVSESVAKGIMGSKRPLPTPTRPVGYLGEIKTGGMYDPKWGENVMFGFESASARAIIYITVTVRRYCTVQVSYGYQNNLYSVDCHSKAPLHVTGSRRKERQPCSRFSSRCLHAALFWFLRMLGHV